MNDKNLGNPDEGIAPKKSDGKVHGEGGLAREDRPNGGPTHVGSGAVKGVESGRANRPLEDKDRTRTGATPGNSK